MSHFANCCVIRKRNKKFKQNYLIDKALECKSIKELVYKIRVKHNFAICPCKLNFSPSPSPIKNTWRLNDNKVTRFQL